MILAAHTSGLRAGGLLPDLARVVRAHLRHRREEPSPSPENALVRALCHDMRGSLTCLESALHQLDDAGPSRQDMLTMARDQAAHLASMLRTAEATGGGAARRPTTGRRLRDVVAASVAASGLPRAQLTLRLDDTAGDVLVGDARLQRILINLLENAHRHGGGASVRLDVTSSGGWVELSVTQAGVPATRVAGHLHTTEPPADLTGLGLWSVQRQARELGGRVLCVDGDGGLTLRVRLPDR
ncbi:MAG: Two component signal transduction histidine kinase [Blastococcus sp.]|nr:Two component signal transduction histidine kinase [Blastococcus sp.]